MPIPEERSIRIEKLKSLRQAGIDPYPSISNRTHTVAEVQHSFEALQSEQQPICLAGRLRLLRRHGGSTFARLEDQSGVLQLFFSRKILGDEAYERLKMIDVGDFIEANGRLFKTKTGEQTQEVLTYALLTKSLRPLPEKWHGLKNEEERYRHRYIDLIVNPEVKEFFRKRSAFIAELRHFLSQSV
jgi:lysyl-tRNA synthetase class 2